MKVLLVTFSDNADYQDITFGPFGSFYKAKRSDCEAWLMRINELKVSVIDTPQTHLKNEYQHNKCSRNAGTSYSEEAA